MLIVASACNHSSVVQLLQMGDHLLLYNLLVALNQVMYYD